MTITVGGTAITFNDGTTQSTAAGGARTATAGTLYQGYYNSSYNYSFGGTPNVYVKVASVRCLVSGTVRVYWTGMDNVGYGVTYARVYKNGVAVGTERSIPGNGVYQQFTDDISVSPGDILQIYGRNTAGGSVLIGSLTGVGSASISSFPLIASPAVGNGVTAANNLP